MGETFTREVIETLLLHNHFNECCVIGISERYENNSENEKSHDSDGCSGDEKSDSEEFTAYEEN